MKSLFFCLKEKLVSSIRFFYALLDDGNTCFLCNKRSLLLPVCKSCIKKFYSVEKAISIRRCIYCGKELISTKNTCMKCRESRVIKHCNYVMPLYSYRLWNKELLYHWKIESNRSLSAFFAGLIKEALVKLGERVIVPVPPRRGKIQKNGWDQIDDLCQFLEKKYGFIVLRILTRHSVKQQKKLNREERLETIKSAYSLVSKSNFEKELKKNKGAIPSKVCLLDDVCTTGSTIEACGQILKKNGIAGVGVITLFTVD
ncbi:MAG: hypothetical protein K6C97_07175 [Treponema sp.]|nr:hypothetical protein [Treponema sp.]